MDRKKMITYAVIVVVVLIILWQGMGMLGGDESASVPLSKPNPETPKAASLLPAQAQKTAQQAPLTEREMQLMKLQQETQAKYLAALTELQMLKVEKDIAETNRDVSKARLENITAQKGIVQLLTPPKPMTPADSYAQGLDNNASATTPAAASTPTTTTSAPATSSGDYKVVSVSKLRGQWMAVMGAGGALYSVKQGDVIPVDGSTVVSIDRDGVQLEKDGRTRKLSMVPII